MLSTCQSKTGKQFELVRQGVRGKTSPNLKRKEETASKATIYGNASYLPRMPLFTEV